MNPFKKMRNRVIRNFRRPAQEDIHALREKHEHWIDKPHVHAIGENDKGLIIFVDEDYSFDDDISSYVASPLTIVKSGSFKAYPNRQAKNRPIFGGISIGHHDITAGTMSLLVRDKTTKEPLILSNNHILANCNKGVKGDAIIQPGTADGGKQTDIVGYLERFVPLKNGALVDAAVAKLSEVGMSRIGVLGFGNTHEACAPFVGQLVKKSGRTTGISLGKILAIGVSVKVDYGGVVYTLVDQIITSAYSEPGDSGSTLQEQRTNRFIGILFAGGGGSSVICKAEHIFNLLNVELTDLPNKLVLDVSAYQGELLDISKAKANGVVAVFVKIAQGNYYFNPKFEDFWAKLKAGGMPCAPYIFIDPAIPASAQFEYFKTMFGDRVCDHPPMFDCEKSTNLEQNTAVIQQFAGLLDGWCAEHDLLPPFDYTRMSWWNPNVKPWSGWKRYPLMVARYDTDLPEYEDDPDYLKYRDWEEEELWQHSADGNMRGREMGFDCNSIDISYAFLGFEQKYLKGIVPPEEEYSLTLSKVGSGIIAANPSNPHYHYGDNVTVTAVPNLGWYFSSWSDNVINGVVSIKGNTTVTATFTNVEPPPIGEYVKGKVIVASLNVRNAPNTSATKVQMLLKNDTPEILEELVVSPKETWCRIGWKQWAAAKYGGVTYIEYPI